MTDNFKLGIAIVFGLIVFIYLFITKVLNNKNRINKFIEKCELEGTKTEATCVSTKLVLGNDESGNSYFKNDRYKVKYFYQVNGKTYYKKITFQSPGTVSTNYPYTIMVYYDKNNPKKAYTKIEGKRSGGCFFSVAVSLIIILVIYNLLKLI